MTEALKEMIYWSHRRLISYNHGNGYFVVVGARGVGKTYDWKKFLINRYLDRGEQWFYIRRYKSELDTTVEKFFDKINEEFPDHEFEVKKKAFWIDGHIAGYFDSLSRSLYYKSDELPQVTSIFYDEFIFEPGESQYLKNEVSKLRKFVSSVFRDRRNNTRVLMSANAVSIINPYFDEWHINDFKREFQKLRNTQGQVFGELEISKMVAPVQDAPDGDWFAAEIAGSDYEKVNAQNTFIDDNDILIRKINKETKFMYNITLDGRTYGVWDDADVMIISQKKNAAGVTLAVDYSDKDNVNLAGRRDRRVMYLLNAARMNTLFFDSPQVRGHVAMRLGHLV